MDLIGSRKRASERFRQILARVDQGEQEARERRPFILTPETFFNLFLVCLSWQYNPAKQFGNWTTVDKVVRVLFFLKVITRKQRRMLFLDRRVQAVFRRHAKFLYYGSGVFSEEAVALSTSPVVIPIKMGTDEDPMRMLRDYRIYLTVRGKEIADGLVPKYQLVVSRDQYQRQIEIDAEFRGKKYGRHMGPVMANYDAKVTREVSNRAPDDEDDDRPKRRKRGPSKNQSQ